MKTNLLFIMLLVCSLTYSQKTNTKLILDFQNASCEAIKYGTYSKQQYPGLIRVPMDSIDAEIPYLEPIRFSTFYSPTEDLSGELSLELRGVARGGLHLTLPLRRRGFYFVVIHQPYSPTLLTINTLKPNLAWQLQKQCTFVAPYRTRSRTIALQNLPDLEEALPLVDCQTLTLNYNLDNHPAVMTANEDTSCIGTCQVVLKDHLLYLPKEELTLRKFLKTSSSPLLEENSCGKVIPFVPQPDGSFKIRLFHDADYFFLIESKLDPSCQVIIWHQTNTVPMKQKTYLRCLK